MNALLLAALIASQTFRPSVSPGAAGVGYVIGPASATDNCLARFDTTTGKLIQNSVVCATDAGVVTVSAAGTVGFEATGTGASAFGYVVAGDGTTFTQIEGDASNGNATVTLTATGSGTSAITSTSRPLTLTASGGAITLDPSTAGIVLGGGTTDPTNFKGPTIYTGFATDPALSAAGTAKLFFDTDSNTLRISQNGGAFADIAGSASGWTDDGTVVRLTAATDSVTIGTATVGLSSKLTVESSDASQNHSIAVKNTSTAGIASLAVSNSAESRNRFIIHGSATTGAFFGIASANLGVINSDASAGLAIGTTGTGPLVFGVGDTEKARFDFSGRLGIGMTPTEEVDILFSQSGETMLKIKNGTTHPAASAVIAVANDTSQVDMLAYSTTFTTAGGLEAPNAFQIRTRSGMTNGLRLSTGAGPIIFGAVDVESLRINTTEIVANDTSLDRDFRVETDANPNALFINGGTDSIQLGSDVTYDADMLGSQVGNSGTPHRLRVPTIIGTAPVAKPACTSTSGAGSIIYLDDTDDIITGVTCVCMADAAGTYAWTSIADFITACPV